MFNVLVAFKGSERQWAFLFKSKERAEKCVAEPIGNEVVISITDDFGTSASIQGDSIAGILIEDMSLAADAAVERGLNQQRAQIKGQNKAANDPLLKLAGARPNGPAMATYPPRF